MFNLKTILMVLLCSLFLCACGPKYETRYAYEPTIDQMVLSCVGQCQQSRQTCENIYREKQLICKNKADLSDDEQCQAPSTCATDYRACYQLCGGQVKSYRVCIENCA